MVGVVARTNNTNSWRVFDQAVGNMKEEETSEEVCRSVWYW